jgi:membrane-bound lytic murein transglycosylase D
MHLLKYIVLAAFVLSLVACTGNNKYASPRVYGTEQSRSSNDDEATTEKTEALSTETTQISKTEDTASGKLSGAIVEDTAKAKDEPADNKKESGNVVKAHQKAQHEHYPSNEMLTDVEDSASAVDDYIWRQFELADEYHAMGVIANREASWEEAQYYLDKSLKILANLDIETDTSLTPEAVKYTSLLDNIIADYRVTLRSLGNLTDEVSAAVIVERFGDLAERLDDDTMRVFKSEQKTITYDLPIVMNDRVKGSIIYFQTVARDAFKKYLRRSKKYKPMMLKKIHEYGLPEDLVYLSMVESAYNPHAYSWARAMGLWQFIASTGRMYGLKRDWWMDERKDPVKSTDAACRFLRDLYKQFGSWELAMAAYNGGPGRVSRTIKKQKTIDFWKMRLKRQTMDYVPLIMAATIISKDPGKYGFEDIEYEPEIVWDEVVIDRCLDLSVVAKEIGCSLKELKTINPEILRNYTPPNKKKYVLKVPAGKTRAFAAAYDNMPSPKETSWARHRIKRGETVSTIASRYGVSQYAILAANSLKRTSKIYAGKELIVPVPLDGDASWSASRSNKSYDNYTSKNSIYVVRRGDTMWDIARAFGTTVSALRRINYIERGSRIYVGQKLKIPSSATKLKKKNKSESRSPNVYASRDADEPSSGNTKSSGSPKKYRVRSGDTLWDIARQFGLTTSKLRQLNGLGRSSRIYPGQQLVVTSNGASYVTHKVRRGETLSRIAKRYRTSVSGIMTSNGLTDPDEIQIGTRLKIYTK